MTFQTLFSLYGVVISVVLTVILAANIQTTDAEYFRNKAAQVQMEIDNSNLDYYELREKELDLQVYNNIVAKNEKFQKIKKNYLKIIFFYDIFVLYLSII